MSTQAAWVVSAFIDIFTNPVDAVKDVSRLTFAAVRAHQVDTAMTFTDLLNTFTLINVDTACALLIEVISSTTVHRVPLTGVRANCVYADLPSLTWARLTYTFIDINTVAKGILDEARTTLHSGKTTEGSLRVLALKLWSTVMDHCLTLINILAVVVVCEFIASPTADLSLAAEGALQVDASFSCSTVTGPKQALIDILTAYSIWFEFVTSGARTGVIAHTDLSTFTVALII